MPAEIINRPKATFSAPLRAWVRNDLREVINDVLVEGELVGSGMIRREALLGLMADEHARSRGPVQAALAAADARTVAPARPVHGRDRLTAATYKKVMNRLGSCTHLVRRGKARERTKA